MSAMNLATLIGPAGAYILVVDDDADLLRLLSMRLRARGYRVTAVDLPRAALARVAVERPDLLLSDVRLRGRTAWRCSRNCAAATLAAGDPAHRAWHHTDAVEATARGVFGYLAKPFDSQQLLEKIGWRWRKPAAARASADGDDAWRREIISQQVHGRTARRNAADRRQRCQRAHPWRERQR